MRYRNNKPRRWRGEQPQIPQADTASLAVWLFIYIIKVMREIVVILHNIRSLHNVGSIFRTADAAGVKKIYLCGITPAPVDRFGKIRPQLSKVSLGAEKSVPWEHVGSTMRLIDKLKNDGYRVFAIEQSRKSIPYYRFSAKGGSPPAGRQGAFGGKIKDLRFKKLALVLGNEVKGLSPAVLKMADKILEIPMRGAVVRQAHHPRRLGRGKMVRRIRQAHRRQAHHKESLNVSVAFGIVVFHLISR